MAGTVNITFGKIDTPYAETHGIVEVLIEWVGDSGDGTVPETAFDAVDTIDILGRYCVLAVTDPDGVTAPTDDYDIVIEDEYGCDVFGGALANRDGANSEQAVPKSEQAVPKVNNVYGGRLCAGVWTFKLTGNSVNSAKGKCVLYFEI